MYKVKVNLVTQEDIKEFVNIADTIDGPVNLIDSEGHCVNAKSILGCLYSVEFTDTFVTSDNEKITTSFYKFQA